MLNFNNKDVCPCLTCEHNNVCMYREKFTLYYDKVNSENRDSNIPECATLSVSCRYARYSTISASCVSRGANTIQGVGSADAVPCKTERNEGTVFNRRDVVSTPLTTPATTGIPYTFDTSSQCKIS